MKITHRALAAIAAVALLATGCGTAPDEGGEPTDPTPAETTPDDADTEEPQATEAAVDYQACQVTDTGGVDDRSFNQTAYEGLQEAEEKLGVEIAFLESQSETDFEPHINAFVDQGCELMVTVGFLLGDATEQAAQQYPDTDFAIVDYAYEETYDNLLGLTFETDQAAFLAGYVAAATTETGTVGTYGGINIPTVSIFMDGFLAGVRYHNEQKGTEVEVIGWDGSDGLFTGDFESQDKGRQTTDQLLQAGADIIMPVAGPVGLGSATAIQDAGRGKLIWVDTDGYESVPEYGHLMLTSVMKNMDVAVFTAVEQGVNGEFEGGVYSGTLEDGGVGIAPFHEFEDAVPQDAKDELEQIRQQIIDGSLSVKSADHAADGA
jgi:basic membrane protein A